MMQYEIFKNASAILPGRYCISEMLKARDYRRKISRISPMVMPVLFLKTL